MRSLPRLVTFAAVLALAAAAAPAQSLLPPEKIPFDSVAAFRTPGANWQLASGVGGDPRHEKILTPVAGTGVLVNNPAAAAREALATVWEHGDMELDLDFLVPAGAESGVYLQGRYGVALGDSWGGREPKASDCGGIAPGGQEGAETGGHAPLANASRAPGLWQHLHIEFVAPRFDAAGKKTKSARFTRVVLNDFVVQENVEVTAPSRGATAADEKALGPLVIRGDGGPIAIRGLAVKRFDASAAIQLTGLAYKEHKGEFKTIGEYETKTPTREGTAKRLSVTDIEKTGKFALVFTGTMTVPHEGEYAFTPDTNGAVRLKIDDREVVTPVERGGLPGKIRLAAGEHPFRIDYMNTGNSRPAFQLIASGPGLAEQNLSGGDAPPAPKKKKTIPLEVKDAVRVQRSFVPYEPRKRVYAINVGTPAGVNYAYDFELSGILRVWRGGFLDAENMWDGRGEPQTASPNGPALTLNALPNVALIESGTAGGWPSQPEALASSQGYSLEKDGLPVFLSRLAEVTLRDRIAPAEDGRGLTRTMVFKGNLPSWSMWALLAESATITRAPGGHGWIVGDREWYVDWPEGSPFTPQIRSTANGRQQLAVRLSKDTLEKPLVYTLVW